MHYQPVTAAEKQEILEEIGVKSFADLVRGIPVSLKEPSFQLPDGLSEAEIQNLFTKLGSSNATLKNHLSFLGGGSYEHFIPAAVGSILARHEFYTAYTPYQPEAAQGTLQAIYEFQSLITELTAMDVSNASHYDGATSLAEAAILAFRHTGRNRILVASTVHPHYRQVLKTYLEGTPYKVEEIGCDATGKFDREAALKLLHDDIAAVVIQTPNFFGVIEDLEGFADQVHQAGALLILSFNPISLSLIKPPGEWGADIAVGEGQPLGLPPHFGGPYLGLFTLSRPLMRKMPGRLAGLTVDSAGKRAFCLTLQAREQHIRREKAYSNICTNQALCALAACVYMTLLGKEGLRELGEINMDRAYYLRNGIAKLPDFNVDITTPIFNEFIVQSKKPFTEIEMHCRREGVLPGILLDKFYPSRKNQFLVCATETKSQADLDRFIEVLASC